MPRRALVADVGAISSQISSGSLPHVKQIQQDIDDDVVIVELLFNGLAQPMVLNIICGDIDVYPESTAYFLSVENAPDGCDQAITDVASITQARTLSDVIQQVNNAILRQQEKSRTGRLPTEDDAIIIHDSSSEDGDGGVGKSTPQSSKRPSPFPDRPKNRAFTRAAGQLSAARYSMGRDSGYDGDNDTTQPTQLATLSSKTKISQNAKSDNDPGDMDAIFDDEFGYISGYDDDAAGVADYAEDNSILYYSSMGKPHPRQERISEDLKAVRRHGYYFGVLSGMNEVSAVHLLAISIRTSDLGLSPQMLLAWDLDPNMFIVLLIRLNSRYQGYESLLNSSPSDIDLSFRIGKCSTYKPFVDDAMEAFEVPKSERKTLLPSKTGANFSKILISKSLATFMNENFLKVARFHEDFKCPWADAVDAVVNNNTRNRSGKSAYNTNQTDDDLSHQQKSFPLVAMQFAMDQLTNCTMYCQACHRQVEEKHRSLKPTVCSTDLCLYQHMNLGLGRSAEYEILCQPNVVDLLINFCYAALHSSLTAKIDPVRAYPTQLPLKIADWNNPYKGMYSKSYGNRTSFILSQTMSGGSEIRSYKPGQWVVVYLGELATHPFASSLRGPLATNHPYLPASPQYTFPSYALRHAVVTGVDTVNSTVYLHHFSSSYGDASNCPAEIFRYTKDFDDISPLNKAAQLLVLLDTMPPVKHLKIELEKPSVTDLKSVSGVSPAAAVVLGWIVATNRSCILQIQEPQLMVKENLATGAGAGAGAAPQPPRGFLQFCFLQGVPEADHAFQQQLTMADNQNHPTILAWHGSKIENWHSILRTGLDFSVTVNGRAFGNGIYFSHDYNISRSYSGRVDQGTQWPNAVLDLESVISLNEIINAPSKFTSCSPHYVVQHPNWSRCRFLFAQPGAAVTITQSPSLHIPVATPAPVPAPAPAPALKQQGSSVLSTMFDSSVYNRPKYNQMAATTTTALPSIHTVVPLPQSSAHSLATQAQSSIHRWQSDQRVQDEFFQQDPRRPAYGPQGGIIVVPTASMPARQSTWEVSERRPKRSKTTSPAPITMDARDLAFLAKGVENLQLQNNKQVPPTTARRRPAAGTKIPEKAVVIDLLSDSDMDEPMRVPSRARPALQSAPAAPLPTPSPVRLNVTPFQPGTLDYSSLPQLPLPSWCTANAQRALAREMDRMQKVQQNTPLAELGWYIDFARMDNMFQWIVELHSFDLSLPLASDMMRLGAKSIVLELRFGADYPMSPPLVRVIRPRFVSFLQGGGGNVTAGGAMCMELLTSTGWTPANQTDAVLLQVRLSISALDRPARLDMQRYNRDYGIGEAFEAYKRAAATHGWQVPADMQKRMTF